MGCHTWSYVKLSSRPKKEIEKLYKESVDIIEEDYKKYSDKKFVDEQKKNTLKVYKDWTESDVDKIYAYRLDEVEKAKKNIKNVYSTIYYAKQNYTDIIERDGEYYYHVGFDNPFRLYGYPDETFTSKDELMKYLEQHIDDVVIYKNGKCINDFTYDELDEEVTNFFDKYGKDNCFIEFG